MFNIIGQFILAILAALMLFDVINGRAIVPVYIAALFTLALAGIALDSYKAKLYIYFSGALFGSICWLTIGVITL